MKMRNTETPNQRAREFKIIARLVPDNDTQSHTLTLLNWNLERADGGGNKLTIFAREGTLTIYVTQKGLARLLWNIKTVPPQIVQVGGEITKLHLRLFQRGWPHQTADQILTATVGERGYELRRDYQGDPCALRLTPLLFVHSILEGPIYAAIEPKRIRSVTCENITVWLEDGDYSYAIITSSSQSASQLRDNILEGKVSIIELNEDVCGFLWDERDLNVVRIAGLTNLFPEDIETLAGYGLKKVKDDHIPLHEVRCRLSELRPRLGKDLEGVLTQ